MKWNVALYDQSHDFVAKFGEGIFSYLKPQPNENILDLGCGTGDLTHKIFLTGAKVLGVDNSAEMIETAKTKFPEVNFRQMDIRDLDFDEHFDAIFSNAVLHWVPEKEKAIEKMYSSLNPGGRIVVEFGGKGNVEKMRGKLRDSLISRGYHENAQMNFWYFPSIGAYASELEKQNFRVVHAEHFDRPTALKGDQGIKDWFLMFGDNFFYGISEAERDEILNEVQSNLQKTHYVDGVWYADYKRIRVIALKE